MPSFTVTMLAAVFLNKFKSSKFMSNALYGIRPVCIGMIASVVIQQSMTNYAGSFLFGISWQAMMIGAVSLMLLRLKWSVPKTIVIAAALGLILV